MWGWESQGRFKGCGGGQSWSEGKCGKGYSGWNNWGPVKGKGKGATPSRHGYFYDQIGGGKGAGKNGKQSHQWKKGKGADGGKPAKDLLYTCPDCQTSHNLTRFPTRTFCRRGQCKRPFMMDLVGEELKKAQEAWEKKKELKTKKAAMVRYYDNEIKDSYYMALGSENEEECQKEESEISDMEDVRKEEDVAMEGNGPGDKNKKEKDTKAVKKVKLLERR